MVYSTYLGGSAEDRGFGIAVDSAGNAYVTGVHRLNQLSHHARRLPDGLGGNTNAFVTKINPTGSALVYSTFLGGNTNDGGYGIAVDSAGNAYIAGYTASTNFPTTPGAFQSNLAGGGERLRDKNESLWVGLGLLHLPRWKRN